MRKLFNLLSYGIGIGSVVLFTTFGMEVNAQQNQPNGMAEASTGQVAAPTIVKLDWQSTPPKLSEQQKAGREACLEHTCLPGPRIEGKAASAVVPPAAGTESEIARSRSFTPG